MAIDAINLHLEAPGIVAFSVKRNSPDPAQPYSGFNVCHYTGDSPAHIAQCRRELAETLGIASDRLIIPRQTHSDNIAVIDTIPFDSSRLEGVDALVTRLDNVALCINTADCVPIVMADTEAKIIAAVHSGWRGTVADIAGKTVRIMQSLGADPQRIHAAMGPSICPRCFEVGEEVADQFLHTFGPHTIIETPTKPHINLPAAITSTLIAAGIPAHNITPPTICSHCNPDTLFSARRHTINSARTLTLILHRLTQKQHQKTNTCNPE